MIKKNGKKKRRNISNGDVKKEVRNWFLQFRTILFKDITSTRRIPKYLFTSIIPAMVIFIMFFLLYGLMTPERMTVGFVDEDNSSLSGNMRDYIQNISSEFGPWFDVKIYDNYSIARKNLEDFKILGLISIPKGFEDNITSNKSGYLLLEVQNINADYVKNFIQRLDEAVLKFNQEHHLSASNNSKFLMTAYKTYLIGNTGSDISMIRGLTVGILGIFGIIFGLLMGALNIAKEYEDKTISEIINSPIKKTAYIASKQLTGVIFGSIIAPIFAVILYSLVGISFKGSFFDILLCAVSFVLSVWFHANLGTLIGWRFKKTMPTILVGIIASIVFWFFSGGLAPPIMLGDAVYNFSRLIPASYWMEILFSVTFNPQLSFLIPRMLTLAFSALLMTIITWTIIKKRGFYNE
ncbi:MAG: ABC transporter permease [Promethearchaeota archaeon]